MKARTGGRRQRPQSGRCRVVITQARDEWRFRIRESCCFDTDGDGTVRGVVTDAIYLLSFNFLGGPPPPAPFPECGSGTPADEALGCEIPPAGCR
jgi:hypothetical protein